MNPLSIAMFTHFLGMVGLFVGYGLEWAASSLLRRSTTSDQARAWLRIYKLSLPISGPGLLIASALEAVLKWKYEPTYLDGTPVPIEMQVTIHFSLH